MIIDSNEKLSLSYSLSKYIQVTFKDLLEILVLYDFPN